MLGTGKSFPFSSFPPLWFFTLDKIWKDRLRITILEKLKQHIIINHKSKKRNNTTHKFIEVRQINPPTSSLLIPFYSLIIFFCYTNFWIIQKNREEASTYREFLGKDLQLFLSKYIYLLHGIISNRMRQLSLGYI
jgi:hypothetical protein